MYFNQFSELNACIKTYPNGTQKITCWNKGVYYNPYDSNTSDSKLNKSKKINSNEQLTLTKSSTPVTRSDSLKRAKDKIFDIAFVNENLWEYMITFTLDSNVIDRYDTQLINKKLKTWLNNSVKRHNLNYLIIPELHKDGAVHFHGLISGDFNFIDSHRVDKSNRKIYNLSNWKFGFSTAVPLDNNKIAVCKYITKYITKDLVNDNSKILGNIYYAGGHDLIRDVPKSYTHIDFDSFEGSEYSIPSTNIKVKYGIIGFLG